MTEHDQATSLASVTMVIYPGLKRATFMTQETLALDSTYLA